MKILKLFAIGYIIITFSIFAYAESLYDDAISYWTFNSSADPSADDLNDNNGILHGTQWTSSGKVGGALIFSGGSNEIGSTNGDYIEIPTSGCYPGGPPCDEFELQTYTISAWVKTDDPALASREAVIVSRREIGHPTAWGYDAYWDIITFHLSLSNGKPQIVGAKRIGFWPDVTKGGVVVAASDTSIIDSNWHHIVATTDSSILKLYVDGNLINSSIYDFPFWGGPISGMQIGRNPMADGYANVEAPYFFSGTIDEVAIWDRALELGEIQILYGDGEGYDPPLGGAIPEPLTVIFFAFLTLGLAAKRIKK